MQASSGSSAHDNPSPTHLAELYRLMSGFRTSQAIYVAAELGIADHLAGGAQGSDTLARAVGADEDALYRLLRLLAGAGLFDEVAPRRFALTEVGAGLRADVPGSIRPMTLNLLDAPRGRRGANCSIACAPGAIGFDHVHAMGLFDYLRVHPATAARFNQAMTSNTAGSGDMIARAYDFSGTRRLIDVGGGHGLLLATILRAYPAMRGVLFDLPEVVADAPPVLAGAGVADRCEVVGGDFFADITPGGDAYLLRHIIHDWDDARSTAILASCRRALPESGKVLVVERTIATDYRQALSVLQLDLQMLVMLGGKERTESEYGALFSTSGLRLNAVVPLGDTGQFSVFEGVPAQSHQSFLHQHISRCWA